MGDNHLVCMRKLKEISTRRIKQIIKVLCMELIIFFYMHILVFLRYKLRRLEIFPHHETHLAYLQRRLF